MRCYKVIYWVSCCFVLTLVSATVVASGVTTMPPADAGAPLGSAAFQPTPDRPTGWRGDWTGRYSGATPPTEWSRRVKGLTTELRCQSAKPVGDDATHAHPVEFFTLRDFLVLGPIDAADPKDIDKEYIPNEATLLPAEGDKVGDLVWKPIHVTMETESSHFHNEGICRNINLDFIYCFGKFSEVSADPKKPWAGAQTKIDGDFTNKIAYACTYVYSPTGGPARLQVPFVGTAAKGWLNAQPLKLDKNEHEFDIDVAKGWNRLLLKVSCDKGLHSVGGDSIQSNWRCSAYITPRPPVSYETHNIAWMTRVTGRSMSGPIVVGDKIFVGSSISDLMCFSKTDGKVLWIRSNTPWDCLTADEQAQYKDIEPLVKQLDQLNDETVTAINAMVSSTGMDSTEQNALDKKLAAKRDAELKIHQAFEKVDKKRFPPMNGNEVTSSNATPCSDGTRVCWACGGGMKGVGASVICAFDLDGKRIWSYHEAFGAAEHGLHTSPVIADGKLIYPACKTLIAFDIATGKIAWRTPCEEFCGNNLQIARLGGEAYIVTHQVAIYRISDGVKLTEERVSPFGDTTPVIEDGVMYHSAKFSNWGNYNIAFAVIPLPNPVSEKAAFPKGWEMSSHDCYMPLRGIDYIVASPLYLDGIVYNLDMTEGLGAIDVNTHKSLYRLWLDGYTRYDRYLYGSVASPTLGGKNIYIVDDAGCAIIFKPGSEYQQVAQNILENIQWSGQGGNPCKQESFYTAPVFNGSDIYLKGEEYLYCIRAK